MTSVATSGAPWLAAAARERFAIPAFNVSNMECIQGVIAAANEAGSPAFLQISPGVIAYAGYETITQLAFAEAARSSAAVIVHLDHCRDPALVRRALADGYGSVMFDGSPLSYEENIAVTSELVGFARDTGASVEGELGEIAGSESMTLDEAAARTTSPGLAADFVKATGVHALAPALGNLHRMPSDSYRLPIDLVADIRAACARPIALHGGSGIDRTQLPEVISAGVGKVNLSTNVTRAFAIGIRDFWAREPDQLDLRRFLGSGRDGVRKMALDYMRLCGSSGRSSIAGTAWTSSAAEAE